MSEDGVTGEDGTSARPTAGGGPWSRVRDAVAWLSLLGGAAALYDLYAKSAPTRQQANSVFPAPPPLAPGVPMRVTGLGIIAAVVAFAVADSTWTTSFDETTPFHVLELTGIAVFLFGLYNLYAKWVEFWFGAPNRTTAVPASFTPGMSVAVDVAVAFVGVVVFVVGAFPSIRERIG